MKIKKVYEDTEGFWLFIDDGHVLFFSKSVSAADSPTGGDQELVFALIRKVQEFQDTCAKLEQSLAEEKADAESSERLRKLQTEESKHE